MPAAGVVLLVAVVLIVLALVYYLVCDDRRAAPDLHGLDEAIAAVGEIVEKTAPVDDGRHHHQPAPRRRRSTRSRACSSRRPGWRTPSASSTASTRAPPPRGSAHFPESGDVKPPRISEVYTRGTLTLARLGREAPIAAASPAGGPVLRNVTGGSLAARLLYPEDRQTRPERLPRSPVIGTDAPVQYEPSEEPGVRRRMPTNGGTTGADPGAV